MSSGRLPKAKAGARQAQALTAIQRFTRAQRDWSVADLAAELGVHDSQARHLVATLLLAGKLERRQLTVKKILPAPAAA